VNEIGSGSRLTAGFVISGVETLGSTTRELDNFPPQSVGRSMAPGGLVDGLTDR
jgi:hypothetical protein